MICRWISAPVRRHLDAEIAARHHHRVRAGDNLVQPVDRRGLLQLRHQPHGSPGERRAPHPGPPAAARMTARSNRRRAGREGEVAAILLGQGRYRQYGAHHTDALAVRQRPADDHACHCANRFRRFAPRAEVCRRRAGAARPARGPPALPDAAAARGHVVPGVGSRSKRMLAPCEANRALREGARPKLRALQIGEHAERPAELRLDPADGVVASLVLGVAAVAEVEPEHVGTRIHELADDLRRRTRRPQRRDDLGPGKGALGHGSDAPAKAMSAWLRR